MADRLNIVRQQDKEIEVKVQTSGGEKYLSARFLRQTGNLVQVYVYKLFKNYVVNSEDVRPKTKGK